MDNNRSARREVRNPVLALPSVRAIGGLDPASRAVLVALLGDLAADARERAQESWRKNKGPMAAYWKAVGAYAEHTRRAIKQA